MRQPNSSASGRVRGAIASTDPLACQCRRTPGVWAQPSDSSANQDHRFPRRTSSSSGAFTTRSEPPTRTRHPAPGNVRRGARRSAVHAKPHHIPLHPLAPAALVPVVAPFTTRPSTPLGLNAASRSFASSRSAVTGDSAAVVYQPNRSAGWSACRRGWLVCAGSSVAGMTGGSRTPDPDVRADAAFGRHRVRRGGKMATCLTKVQS